MEKKVYKVEASVELMEYIYKSASSLKEPGVMTVLLSHGTIMQSRNSDALVYEGTDEVWKNWLTLNHFESEGYIVFVAFPPVSTNLVDFLGVDTPVTIGDLLILTVPENVGQKAIITRL